MFWFVIGLIVGASITVTPGEPAAAAAAVEFPWYVIPIALVFVLPIALLVAHASSVGQSGQAAQEQYHRARTNMEAAQRQQEEWYRNQQRLMPEPPKAPPPA